MGIIVNDTVATSFGIDLANPYISIANNNIRIYQTTKTTENADTETVYIIDYITTTWKDQAARNANMLSVETKLHSVEVSAADISQGIYELAYANLKSKHPNHENA
jgi:hypothetical protein